jgi:hypothetical protein
MDINRQLKISVGLSKLTLANPVSPLNPSELTNLILLNVSLSRDSFHS